MEKGGGGKEIHKDYGMERWGLGGGEDLSVWRLGGGKFERTNSLLLYCA